MTSANRGQPWPCGHGYLDNMAVIHRANTDITPHNASPRARGELGTRGHWPRLATVSRSNGRQAMETTSNPCPRCRGEEYLDGDNGMVLCPRCCGTGDA